MGRKLTADEQFIEEVAPLMLRLQWALEDFGPEAERVKFGLPRKQVEAIVEAYRPFIKQETEISNEDEYIDRARKAAEDYLRGNIRNGDARVSAALAGQDDDDGTGSVREGHTFLSAEDMRILKKVEVHLDRSSICKDLYQSYCRALAKIAAQTTDPLPVMEDAANGLKWFKHNSPQFHNECDGNVLDILFDTIAQIKRERGQTDAAEHVDKLKEVRDESNP